MKNYKNIILLISQDLKFNKLMQGLQEIGLDDGGLFGLEIRTVVSEMMQIDLAGQEDTFEEIYQQYMDMASQLESSRLDQQVAVLAGRCYQDLCIRASVNG